jgi:hypothetical protein
MASDNRPEIVAELRVKIAELEEREAQRSEPSTAITVRLSQRLHLRLKEVAHDRRLSLNQLCVHTLARAAGLSRPETIHLEGATSNERPHSGTAGADPGQS